MRTLLVTDLQMFGSMKRQTKKLTLCVETLRTLNVSELAHVNGGDLAFYTYYYCINNNAVVRANPSAMPGDGCGTQPFINKGCDWKPFQ